MSQLLLLPPLFDLPPSSSLVPPLSSDSPVVLSAFSLLSITPNCTPTRNTSTNAMVLPYRPPPTSTSTVPHPYLHSRVRRNLTTILLLVMPERLCICPHPSPLTPHPSPLTPQPSPLTPYCLLLAHRPSPLPVIFAILVVAYC